MISSDAIKHVKGESIFLDDMPIPEGTLYAAVMDSPIAHGQIKLIDITHALELRGVAKIILSKNIPGENQIGNIIADESLLAENTVEYIGEPIAIVIAESLDIARKARKLIKIEFEERQPITDPREAFKIGNLIVPPNVFSSGNTDATWDECEFVFSDTISVGGQEHLYLETQGAVAIPSESGNIKLYSSTQSPTVVQKAVAKVLGLSMHKIEVDVLRLGGAFGGKEDQATPWAVIAALGTHLTGKPVKLILNRQDDLRMTGKRHPYSIDYRIGLSKDLKIKAYEVTYYQNAGACADLSTAILERTLFHVTNSYFVPNVKATGISCKTNLPPNTAFRGFGGPQAMFAIETAIHNAALNIGVDPIKIQQANLLKEKDVFHYGQLAERALAEKCWNECVERFNYSDKLKKVNEFNKQNRLVKKGLSLMPVCFGISFTNSMLNQASALVHIYTDGSVSISTAAVEMGQGVNEKMINIAARILSIDQKIIKVESTNTTRVANTSATAASSGADLNGNALLIACNNLLGRLIRHAADVLQTLPEDKIEIKDTVIHVNGKSTDLNWNKLINSAYVNRISLTSQAFYATPDIYFNRDINHGHPFAYHVYGTAITEVTVDCLRGIYEIDSVEVVHDFGKSINPLIDLGQAEGGIVQGIGWMTIEELVQDEKGQLKSNSLSTYKIPDIYSAPKNINVHFFAESENPFGPLKSKAIGEPPFMYGIGAYFAILNAIRSFNKGVRINYSAPVTHEKTLMMLYDNEQRQSISDSINDQKVVTE